MDKTLILKAAIPAFLLPTVAKAGPVIPVAAAIGGAIGLTGAAAVAVGAVAIAAVGYVAVKAVGSALVGAFAPDIPSYDTGTVNQSEQIEGVKLTRKGTNEPIPVVYGHRRIGGKIVFAETHGDTDEVTNRYLTVVYALCEGEIHQIKRIFIDEVQIQGQLNPAFNTEIDVSQGRYSGRLRFQLFAGTENQSQSSLANATPSWGSKTRRMPGIAYAVMRYEWKHLEDNDDAEANPYGGGIPNVMFDIVGKKVYDVTTHTGNSEDLANDYADLTKTVSYNPANHLLDFLMNPRFGCGITKEEIDAKYFWVAANKLNQLIDYDENGTQDGPAMTGNTVLDPRAKLMENVKTLVQGCRGFLPYSRGRYKLRIDDGGNNYDIESSNVDVVYDVTEDELLYGMTLSGENKAQKYNQVIVKYIDPDRNFTEQQVIYPKETSTEYTTVLAEDNGEQLTGEFIYPTVSNSNIAENLARTIYKKSRAQRYIKFTGAPQLMELEVGDIIRVTSTVFDLSQQTFRVTKLTINENATLEIEAREHDATIYPFVQGAQIETPPQTFQADFYSLVPIPIPQPEVPVAVRPPNLAMPIIILPPGPKGGFGIDVPTYTPSPAVILDLTINDILPDSPDTQATLSVTQFREFGDQGGTTALLNNVAGFTAPINAELTNRGDGASAEIKFNFQAPLDPTIERVVFYRLGIQGDGRVFNIRRVNVNTSKAQQGPLTAVLPYYGQSYFVVRFEKFNGQQLLDGSTGTYSAISYLNLDGQTVTGTNLEAAINAAIQGFELFVDPDRQEIQVSLL